jgi:histidinol phosphatase-like enzyme
VANSARKTIPRNLTTVFLDRDGVLNEKMPEGSYVRSLEDFHVLPGVPEAVAHLNQAGLRVVVVSNQRGIALGLYNAPARSRPVQLPQAATRTLRAGRYPVPCPIGRNERDDR